MEASSPPCACGMSSSPHVSELALSATVCGPSSAWQESRPKHVPVLHAVQTSSFRLKTDLLAFFA